MSLFTYCPTCTAFLPSHGRWCVQCSWTLSSPQPWHEESRQADARNRGQGQESHSPIRIEARKHHAYLHLPEGVLTISLDIETHTEPERVAQRKARRVILEALAKRLNCEIEWKA